MLGVADQIQAGERLGVLVRQSIMVPKRQARLSALEKQEPFAWLDADWIAQVSTIWAIRMPEWCSSVCERNALQHTGIQVM
jgi:hypothetical protein